MSYSDLEYNNRHIAINDADGMLVASAVIVISKQLTVKPAIGRYAHYLESKLTQQVGWMFYCLDEYFAEEADHRDAIEFFNYLSQHSVLAHYSVEILNYCNQHFPVYVKRLDLDELRKSILLFIDILC